jgi:hypothetical protein
MSVRICTLGRGRVGRHDDQALSPAVVLGLAHAAGQQVHPVLAGPPRRAHGPPPYQSRERRPGKCGWTWSLNTSIPTVPAKGLDWRPSTKCSNRSTRP